MEKKKYNCRICGRMLRVLKSIFRGIGPICWKFGYMKRVFNKYVLPSDPSANIETFNIPVFVRTNRPCFGCKHLTIIHAMYDQNLDKLIAKKIHKNIFKHVPEATVRNMVMSMDTMALPGFCSEIKEVMDGNVFSATIQHSKCPSGSEFEFKMGVDEDVPEEDSCQVV